ncbi:hypothetical protein V8E36_006431 [Tilletia maclaganii]
MTSTASLGASSALSASHAASFFTVFRDRLAQLSERIDAVDSAATTSSLVHEVADARRTLLEETDRIPPRDREGHERLLRELTEKLAVKSRSTASDASGVDGTMTTAASSSSASAPRPRFAFKRNPAKALPLASASASTAKVSPSTSTADAAQHPPQAAQDAKAPSTSSDLRLENRSSAIIDLRTHARANELLTIQIRSLSDCIVLIPPLSGSVMVHDCSRCLFVVEKCRQYRMHKTVESTVVLQDCPTGATIEGCSKILFTASLAKSTQASRFSVQDFDHVSSLTASPHWRWLPPVHSDALQERFDSLLASDPSAGASADAPGQTLRENILSDLHTLIREQFST